MNNSGTNHSEQLVYLKKIEGQIRGLQKMIEEGRYCVDILTQIQSISGAVRRVENNILKKHLAHCVVNAIESKSEIESHKKVEEVINLITRLKKG